MKHVLWILIILTLGCGCKEDLKDEYPRACSLAMIVPISEILVVGMQPNTFYQYRIDNKILWDDCSRSSDMELYNFIFDPTPNPHVRFQGTFENELATSSVRAQVFELNSQCVVSSTPIFDQTLTVHSSDATFGAPPCSGSYEKKQLNIIF